MIRGTKQSQQERDCDALRARNDLLKRETGFLVQEEDMEDFAKIATLENDFEAQLLDSILTERDIPHLMRSYHDTAYDGLYQTQKGWGHVSAPPSYRDEILEILSDLRKEADHAEPSFLPE